MSVTAYHIFCFACLYLVSELLAASIAGQRGCGHLPSNILTLPSQFGRGRRVAGGQGARMGEFPWQVRLRSFGRMTYSGVLVDYNWVLTAASCFNDNYDPSRWNAMLGDTDTLHKDATERSVFVEGIYIYGGFRSRQPQHNLALVKLRPDNMAGLDIQFSQVCLPTANPTLSNEATCYLTGWGATQKGGSRSTTLQKLQVHLANYNECSAQGLGNIGPAFLCASGTDPNAGPCTGDVGSPVLCNSGGQWTVLGVVSQEYACDDNSQGARMFVNVSHYYQWINKVISTYYIKGS